MASVRNNRCGTLRLAYGVTLAPGVNSIDDDVWKRCGGHAITVHYIERKDIVVASESVRKVDAITSPPLAPSDVPLGSEADDDAGNASLQLALPATASEPEPVPDPSALEAMRAKDVIAIVQAVADVNQLEDMRRVEARSTVVRAIERRMAELEG